MTPHSTEAGARNLLQACAGLVSGDTLLVISEPPDQSHYRAGLAEDVADTAASLGIGVIHREVPFSEAVNVPVGDVRQAMDAADCTLFLARLGDQIRFRKIASNKKAVVSYVLDPDMLASPFGMAEHAGLVALKTLIDRSIAAARSIRVTCKAGTDFEGSLARGGMQTDVRVIRFPMSVFSAVSAAGFSGRIAQRGFLVGTGSHYYEPYACRIEGTLFVAFQDNRLTGFTGSPDDVATARAHYQMVAQQHSIDRDFVHSWHAGIHPGCAFPETASANFERWTCGAFGNPRLLHFHTCGAYAPGEISLNILDPTVTIDDVAIWEDGRLFPDRLQGGREILARFPLLDECFQSPSMACGTGPSGQLSFD